MNDEACTRNDLIRLWLCRIFNPPKTRIRLFNKLSFQDPDVADYLGFGEWIDPVEKAFRPEIVRRQFEALYKDLEARAETLSLGPEVEGNFRMLGRILGLSELETRLLKMIVVFAHESVLMDAFAMMGNLDLKKMCDLMSMALREDPRAVAEAISARSRLITSGMLRLEPGPRYQSRMPMFFSPSVAERLLSENCDEEKLLAPLALAAPAPHLKYRDYAHIRSSLSVLRAYLRTVLKEKRPGVNIFLHGPPGCGKTQLSRLLAREMRCRLFEISSEDEEGDPIASLNRLHSLQLANNVLGARMLLAFEEAEDVFHDGGLFRLSTAQTHKAWMNRMLETNRIPTLWIANRVTGMDSANIRRFDLVIEMPLPPSGQREKIIGKACARIASKEMVSKLAKVEALAPAVVERAASVIRTAGEKIAPAQRDGVLENIIAGTLKAQGAAHSLGKAASRELPGVYDLACLNADTDLRRLGASLKKHPKCRMVLYGPPGTGKTSFAYHLAEQLGLPIHGKRASDILSPYVGTTERNLARVFEEATREKAILLLDEVDSFLQDRNRAVRSWEVSQTNELLTQMETFDSIFIASTNLMNDLDRASLRRFDLKIHFGYLEPPQSRQLFAAHCEELKLGKISEAAYAQAAQLSSVTPGDYANVARQHRFRAFADPAAFIDAVAAECQIKGVATKGTLGFN